MKRLIALALSVAFIVLAVVSPRSTTKEGMVDKSDHHIVKAYDGDNGVSHLFVMDYAVPEVPVNDPVAHQASIVLTSEGYTPAKRVMIRGPTTTKTTLSPLAREKPERA